MGNPPEIQKIVDEADLWAPLDERLIEQKIKKNEEAGIPEDKLLELLYKELRQHEWGILKLDRRVQQLKEQISYMERKRR